MSANRWHGYKAPMARRGGPIRQGRGMNMLMRMGWSPGEGLGRGNHGILNPLMPKVKTNRTGLVAHEEKIPGKKKAKNKNTPGKSQKSQKINISSKHPITALIEVCYKERWDVPFFECIETGTDFVYKVTVKGTDYQPEKGAANKKTAKADAAQFALESLGLVENRKKSEAGRSGPLLRMIPGDVPELSSVGDTSAVPQNSSAAEISSVPQNSEHSYVITIDDLSGPLLTMF